MGARINVAVVIRYGINSLVSILYGISNKREEEGLPFLFFVVGLFLPPPPFFFFRLNSILLPIIPDNKKKNTTTTTKKNIYYYQHPTQSKNE